RSAADLVDVVERLVGPFLKARCRGDRQVSPRRETNHADSLGIDAPPPGSAAYQADGSLGILERPPRPLALGLVGTSWYPILEDDSRHDLRSEPGCDLFTFQFPEEVPVAAPGTDQDRGSRILVLRRPIDREGRFADVGHQPGRLGDLDLFPGELRRHADRLRTDVTGFVWNLAGPQLHDGRLVSADRGRGHAQPRDEGNERHDSFHGCSSGIRHTTTTPTARGATHPDTCVPPAGDGRGPTRCPAAHPFYAGGAPAPPRRLRGSLLTGTCARGEQIVPRWPLCEASGRPPRPASRPSRAAPTSWLPRSRRPHRPPALECRLSPRSWIIRRGRSYGTARIV